MWFSQGTVYMSRKFTKPNYKLSSKRRTKLASSKNVIAEWTHKQTLFCCWQKQSRIEYYVTEWLALTLMLLPLQCTLQWTYKAPVNFEDLFDLAVSPWFLSSVHHHHTCPTMAASLYTQVPHWPHPGFITTSKGRRWHSHWDPPCQVCALHIGQRGWKKTKRWL